MGNTLLLSFITVAAGSFFGVFLCLARMAKFKPLNWLVMAVVEVVRGTPLLLQLYIGYFLVPQILPFRVSAYASVTVALVVNSACYVSEVFRSGIQAVKNILPALGNEFVTVIKETSLASTFFVGELMTSYLIVKGNNFLTMECLMITGALYFILNFVLSRALNAFERRMKASD